MKKFFFILMLFVALMPVSSCVNEWPHSSFEDQHDYNKISLLVHCNTSWLPDESITYSRGEESLEISYQFQIYREGEVDVPIGEYTIYTSDFQRNDFTVDFELLPGVYDVYVWSDYCDANTGGSLYYDTTDFAAISYLKPYQGGSNNKDVFRGYARIIVDDDMIVENGEKQHIDLDRPLARYVFIATDVKDYIEQESVRGKMQSKISGGESYNYDITTESEILQRESELLSSYSVKIIYPLYMPAVFNNFINNPIDSWTNISFTEDVVYLTDEEAFVGMDYVMVVGETSSVQVMLEIYDEDNELISRTNTIMVPIQRDRTTLIYGKFLTTLESGGVTIDPNFDGDYNIEFVR